MSVLIALMMAAVNTSKTSVSMYQTTLRNNPEDSRLRAHRHGNVKHHCLNIHWN
jgi:hypothetical protein